MKNSKRTDKSGMIFCKICCNNRMINRKYRCGVCVCKPKERTRFFKLAKKDRIDIAIQKYLTGKGMKKYLQKLKQCIKRMCNDV